MNRSDKILMETELKVDLNKLPSQGTKVKIKVLVSGIGMSGSTTIEKIFTGRLVMNPNIYHKPIFLKSRMTRHFYTLANKTEHLAPGELHILKILKIF